MAYNPYANANYKAKTIETYSPGELLVALFDGCILNLNKAKIHIEKKEIENAYHTLNKAQKIVRYLNASLDMKYPISEELRNLYDFFDRELTLINMRKDAAKIDELLPLIEELKVSFAQADKINRQQHSM